MTDKVLSHDIKEIIACRNANYVLPKELEKYCVDKYINDNTNCNFSFAKDIEKIARLHADGINPNDIAIMNMIRCELNKMNHGNYKEHIAILKSLSFSNEDHFNKLAQDLIAQAMNDPTVIRNTIESEGNNTPSDIYVSVIVDFSDFSIQCENRAIKFKTVFLSRLLDKFKEFTDVYLKLDTNNQHSINIYKGLMNMIGLLYNREYISEEFVMKILEKITSIIVSGNIPVLESDNYYSGYEKITNCVLKHDKKNTNFTKLCEYIVTLNKQITESNGLRKFSRETHAENSEKIKLLAKP